ncbi:GSCFA domain-containing protein [Pontibacter sp. JH31]|uniref:GSCFA domain-containing protein n=1 Tax=Pontibacter aquaedesilientis TaxID=2766980 RepID=A0ABR7XHQ5_9BACT|nr:GSCFA domain-containing protein [Pontibacter aquaedesilientis]MBD1397833.1 GSCFA domain-containing protein [Pontibacter aquaedesilientis]
MFRTEVNIPASDLSLTLQDGMVTIGSCFAEVIGGKLLENKANVLVNPFGTVFNPLSVCRLLQATIGQQHSFENNLVQHDGIWYAYDLHSSLSSPNRAELLQLISERLEHTNKALKQAKLLIITLGTAIGYRLQSTGEVVANCHKLPARQFNRELLSIETIQADFENTLALLRQFNPKLQVLLTVSPVRHIKETIETNSVSKAMLRVLCHQLTQPFQQVSYFPAFEIMMDDLRDYRFYGRDMVHPTAVAEDYIWDKFTNAYLDKSFLVFLKEWEKMRRAVAHRPFHPQSEAHQSFLNKTLQQLHALSQRYSLDISEEAQVLQRQIIL